MILEKTFYTFILPKSSQLKIPSLSERRYLIRKVNIQSEIVIIPMSNSKKKSNNNNNRNMYKIVGVMKGLSVISSPDKETNY